MREIGKTIKQMEKELFTTKMALYFKAPGWMIYKKERVSRDGQMELITKECIEME